MATLVLYGELHLMTLVMSMRHHQDFCRLYALLSDRTHGAWRSHVALAKPDEGWQSAFVGIVDHGGGLSNHDVGSFPGIRQMAVFAATGLSASCLTVFSGILVVPQSAGATVPAMGLMLRWLAAWRRNKRCV